MYLVEGNERIVASEDRSALARLQYHCCAALRRCKRSRSLLSAYICTFQSLSVVRHGYVCSSGNNATPGRKPQSLHKRSTITDIIMVNRRRVYRGSGENLNSG